MTIKDSRLTVLVICVCCDCCDMLNPD